MAGPRSFREMIALLVFLLAACAGQSGGAPSPAASATLSAPSLAVARGALERDCLGAAEPGGGRQGAAARRNELLTAYIFAIDVNYNEYERRLLGNGRGSIAAAIMSTGGRNDAVRDRILAIIQRQVLTQMRAGRAVHRDILLANLDTPYDEWNSCTAWAVLAAYERAGTLDAALHALSIQNTSPPPADAPDR